jgi:uncharacterized metal-binding protein
LAFCWSDIFLTGWYDFLFHIEEISMSCNCGAEDTLIFACSGGSNVGQIANDAGKALDQLGQGRMYCLIGIGADIPSFVEATRKAARVVAIDGCGVACAKATLEKAGITPDAYVVATDLGIEKGHHFEHTTKQVAQVAAKAAESLASCACN